MSTLTFYGLRACDTCRRARAWLDTNGVRYRYVDVRDDGLDAGVIARWADTSGWESLVNRRSRTWRQLPHTLRDDLDRDNAIRTIVEHPTLLKRPVLDAGESLEIGFSPQRYRVLVEPCDPADADGP